MSDERPAPRTSSLRRRLLRAVVVLALALVAVSAIAAATTFRLGGAVGLILRENYVSVVACREMIEALDRQDAAVAISATGRDELARGMLDEGRRAFDVGLRRESANVTLPGESELVRAIDGPYREYVAAVDRVLALLPERRGEAYAREVLPRFEAARARIAAIRELNQSNMEAADRDARRIARRARQLSLLLSAAALVLGAWLVRRTPAAVLGPIATFVARARAIGEGKLDAHVPLPEVLELRPLAEAMNGMQDKLRAYRESSLGELLAAKDLARSTIASMTDPILVFGAAGNVALSNDAAERIFGVEPDADDVLRRGGAPIPEPITLARDAVLATGRPVLPESLAEAMRWITPSGEGWFVVRAVPLRSDDPAARGVIVIAQDVTRFRRIDALKSDVVATVSHELKTPLTSLRLATHMLLDESVGELNETQRELAGTACEETERLQGTVNELLDLVRIERDAGAPQRQPIAARSLLEEAASAHRALAARRSIRVDVEPGGVREPVELDPEQVSIVLANLVSNAIRHSPDGASVELSAREEDGSVVFSVADHGEGIAKEVVDRIFERHWSGALPATLKGRHGLGLAIAKDIAARHGGSIEVESTVGVGSTFRLRLPRCRRAGA